MAVENKVQFGLKNVHIAVATDTGTALTYEDYWAQRGAVEISLDPAGESNAFYADDTDYFDAISNQGYEGKLTVALLSDMFRQKVLGDTLDSNGLLVESNQNKQHNFAMSFEFDGDQTQTRHVLYNVSATRPSMSGKSKEDKTEPDTQELEFTAAPNPYTGNTKAKTTATTSKEIFDAWYDKVQEPGDPVVEAPEA